MINKFHGIVGFEVSIEDENEKGIYGRQTIERMYKGEAIDLKIRWKTGKINEDEEISNQISILADAFAYENFTSIRYIEFMNSKWKVNSIEVKHPRLILSVGGLYNE